MCLSKMLSFQHRALYYITNRPPIFTPLFKLLNISQLISLNMCHILKRPHLEESDRRNVQMVLSLKINKKLEFHSNADLCPS